MTKLPLIALLGSSGLLFSQTIWTGTVEQCRDAQRRLCANEKAPANLELSTNRLVSGTVIDQSGAKFDHDVSVQLRSPQSGDVLRTATVMAGEINLGEARAGKYRLIVVSEKALGPERLAGFDQAQSLTCKEADGQCSLTVMPIVHGTDNPIEHCPPK
jgi:hypothetical protein